MYSRGHTSSAWLHAVLPVYSNLSSSDTDREMRSESFLLGDLELLLDRENRDINAIYSEK